MPNISSNVGLPVENISGLIRAKSPIFAIGKEKRHAFLVAILAMTTDDPLSAKIFPIFVDCKDIEEARTVSVKFVISRFVCLMSVQVFKVSFQINERV